MNCFNKPLYILQHSKTNLLIITVQMLGSTLGQTPAAPLPRDRVRPGRGTSCTTPLHYTCSFVVARGPHGSSKLKLILMPAYTGTS